VFSKQEEKGGVDLKAETGGIYGRVFNIQKFSLHDGPGIRTTVFLKGCPLRCRWCDNPESWLPEPELGFSRSLCDKCGKCLPACTEGAISLDEDGMPQIDRKRCTVCEMCVTACPREALAIYGKSYTAQEVFQTVYQDAHFYRGSGGGVTFSGGEPLLQPSFVVDVCRLCHEAHIHTAMETSGYADSAALKDILPHIDLLFYDLKHMDPDKHTELTGQSNSRILDNASLAVRSGANIWFRIPLIPGINDTPQNIHNTSLFARELLGESAFIELMPYHPLGAGKYEATGRTYPLSGLEIKEPEYVELARQAFEKQGVRCLVSR